MTGQTFQKKKDVKRLQEAKGPVQEVGRKARKRKKKQHAQQKESQDMEDTCKKSSETSNLTKKKKNILIILSQLEVLYCCLCKELSWNV